MNKKESNPFKFSNQLHFSLHERTFFLFFTGCDCYHIRCRPKYIGENKQKWIFIFRTGKGMRPEDSLTKGKRCQFPNKKITETKSKLTIFQTILVVQQTKR